MRSSAFTVLACVVLPIAATSGCATDAERAAVMSAAHGTRVDLGMQAPPRTAVLQFEAKKPSSRPFPFPFVEVKVGAETTRFLVDTAATVHSVDAAVVKNAQLVAPVKLASITLEGWGALPDQPVAVVELPATIRAHGIGGVLSPQLLAKGLGPGQALAVDLVRAQLRAQPRSAAWANVEDLGIMLTTGAQRLCSADASGVFPGQLLTVDGVVDGEATRIVGDSGASRSFFVEGSKAGAKAAARPLAGHSSAQSALAELPVALRAGVPLTVGAWSQTADVGIAAGERDPHCGHEGHLGMDVLQRCAIAIAGDEAVLGCRPAIGR
ncbi:MAG TPA: hypothetical protein VLT33_46290 [Labilithrix sp.]|nr:hypothetical protein [Labilithrix sp.]